MALEAKAEDMISELAILPLQVKIFNLFVEPLLEILFFFVCLACPFLFQYHDKISVSLSYIFSQKHLRYFYCLPKKKKCTVLESFLVYTSREIIYGRIFSWILCTKCHFEVILCLSICLCWWEICRSFNKICIELRSVISDGAMKVIDKPKS